MHRSSGQLAVDAGFGPFTDRVVSEPFPKRVRARIGDTWVLDSLQARLAWFEGPTPDYAIPAGDLATGAHEETGTREHERLGRVAELELIEAEGDGPAGVRILDAPDSAPGMADHVVLDWDAVDAWFVEDDRQRVHPRDPYKRIDVHETSREVVAEVDEARLATSTRTLAVFETGLPTRYYLPEADVRVDLLEDSETVTRCAYKGTAEHFHAHVRGGVYEDVAWTYPTPEPGFGELQDRICFYDERVRLLVDGEDVGTPDTPWS